MSRLVKFLRRSHFERRLLLEAAFWMGVSRAAVLLLPFRWITPYLGEHMGRSLEERTPGSEDIINQIAWAIGTTGRHLPWECKCLVRAMTGKQMLRRRGISSTLYLGLAKDRKNGLEAHAWLRSGDIILTGRHEMDRYTIVSTFA